MKASDVGLETADSVLKWTSSEKVRILTLAHELIFLLMKVEPIMMGLRRVRTDVGTVRKEGVIRNGTDKVLSEF